VVTRRLSLLASASVSDLRNIRLHNYLAIFAVATTAAAFSNIAVHPRV